MALEKVNSIGTNSDSRRKVKESKEGKDNHNHRSSCKSHLLRPFTKCISSATSKGRRHMHHRKKEEDEQIIDECETGSTTDEKSHDQSTSEEEDDDCKPPPLEEWPNRPIYIQPAEDTECFTCTSSLDGYEYELSSVPIGVPVQFESSLFKGKILIRVRNVPICSDNHRHQHDDHCNDDQFQSNPTITTKEEHKEQKQQKFHCEEYFKGKKRMRQYVIQGQFKEEVSMSDVYMGDYYNKPLGLVPPPVIEKILKAAFRRLQPGLIMDLTSEKPKVVVLMAGAVKSMSIDTPGNEPDITQFDLPENTKLINNEKGIKTECRSEGFPSQEMRRKVLSNPQTASNYTFHPGKVYTFNNFDDVFDLSAYRLTIPGMKKKFNLSKILNGQPTTIRATKTDGLSLFNFNVFHESIA